MKSRGILLYIPHFTTAYHPQTDGLSEAFVKKMKEVVRLVSSEDEWATNGFFVEHRVTLTTRDLPRIKACINHSWQSSLDCPASSVLFGYTPHLYTTGECQRCNN